MEKNDINVTLGSKIDGINLNKDEFKRVSKIYHKMFNEVGEKFSNKENLINLFKSEMRQKFNVSVLFENVSKNNDDDIVDIEIVACRFKENRPLIFLVIDNSNSTWLVIDEKRFPPLGENSPFSNVKI